MQKLLRFFIVVLAIGLFWRALPAQGQSSAFAEAIQFAKVRTGPAISFAEVGTIYSGTKYPIVGQSAQYPWVLIQLPDTQGWVFKDIIKITGSLQGVPYTTLIITPGPTNTPTLQATTAQPVTVAPTSTGSITPSPTRVQYSTPTATPTGVTIEPKQETNVRFGPGTDFPRIGTIFKGTTYQALRRHISFNNWLEIAVPGMGGGRGWVNKATVDIHGDLSTLPATDDRDFGYPTLTPTPIMVLTSQPPWTSTPEASSPSLEALANQIYSYLLTQNYAPFTEQQASLFIYDLQTGASYTLNPGVAYSGMSLIKIPILVTLFKKIGKLPSKVQAGWIAAMMVCSDNLASNAILRFLGNGDPYKGGGEVTATMAELGLKDTFLLAPFSDDPSVTPEPVQTIKTEVDQVGAGPDPFNQTSPASLGWLLESIYRCALDGSGPLIDTYPDSYSMNKCRQILRAMSADHIGKLFEAGLPPGTLIAHKHGWITDTRGDAAIIWTPGGNYVLTLELHTHSNEFSDYNATFLVASEVSRQVYNAYNPGSPVAKVQEDPNATEHCDSGADLIADLGRSDVPMIGSVVAPITPTQPPPPPK
jgi:uncharacterized protein YraI